MRLRLDRIGKALFLGASLFTTNAAFAGDRVAVLRFTGSGGTARAELESARAAAREAVGLVHDSLPSAAELAAGEARVVDGAPDTTTEYRTAGVSAGASWTVAGNVVSHGWTYRLELEACQVASGRVESLSREIDARQPAPQIAEMLALLLRPQGVADTVPPWETTQGPGPVLRVTPPRAPELAAPHGPQVTPAPETKGPVRAAEPPFGVGLGVEVLGSTASRNAVGSSSVAGVLAVHAATALAAAAGFELIADGSAAVLGWTSLSFDVGARYVAPVSSSGKVLLGPEIAFGGFFPLGGDKDTRLLSRGDVVLVVCVQDDVDVEAYPEAALAAGGSASVWFLGAGVRAVVRF